MRDRSAFVVDQPELDSGQGKPGFRHVLDLILDGKIQELALGETARRHANGVSFGHASRLDHFDV